jgi:transposase-like protein
MFEKALESTEGLWAGREGSDGCEAEFSSLNEGLPQSRAVKHISGITGQSVEAEVVPVAGRRRFSVAYKLRILEEADRCTESGQIGLLLRREGLYSHHLYNWRKWRREMSQKRDGGVKGNSSLKVLRNENARLNRENRRLQLKLKKAEALLELQKKASEILGLSDADENGND